MDWDKLADEETIQKTVEALKKRNIDAEIVDTRQQALQRLKELVPEGAEIMSGGSTTLEQIGFIDLLKSGKHPWKNWKDLILAEKDAGKRTELRKRSITSEYFLGSVHAIAKTGEVVVASATGSQLPGYVFSSNNVIWVVGTQKITVNLDEAIRRVREYVLPLEDKRMKSIGESGSTIGKLLIFEREIMPNRKVRVIFVKEKLGF
jgi:hypothetical protein